ncbi:MAG: heavy-metal-associated domain-containing protein [bacterium]
MQSLSRISIAVYGAMVLSCSSSEREQNPPAHRANGAAQTAQISQIEIKVPTIQCKNCVANIERALKNVGGVQSAKVDLQGKVAIVSYDRGGLGLADLEKAVTAAGYDANDKKRDPEAYDMLDACCKEPKDGGGH